MKYFTSEKKDNVDIIRFAFDELSLDQREALKKELNDVLQSNETKIVLNLSKIGFLSSLMIATIISFTKDVKDRNGDVKLCELSKVAMDVVKITHLDKAFENRVRLGIMSALVVNEYVDFNTLKELLGVTDGNLASHLKSLEKSNYITFKKKFTDRKPQTTYYATEHGVSAFKKHINAIEKLLK